MMDRTTVSIVTLSTVVFLGLFTSVAYVNVLKYKAKTEMVVKGANPVAVYCALDGINASNQGVCQVASTQTLSKSLEK